MRRPTLMSELEPYVFEGEVLEGEIIERPTGISVFDPQVCPVCRYRYSLAVNGGWLSRYGCTSRSSRMGHAYCGQRDTYVWVGE